MTKEELLNKASKLAEASSRGTDVYRDLLEFFSQNVVIPRGENRHPSSDILHKAIEGIKIQGWNHIRNEWEDDTSWFIDKNDLDYPTKYRIKPSEPIYEYLWLDLITPDTYGAPTHRYMTHEEAFEYFKHSELYICVNETKRERR